MKINERSIAVARFNPAAQIFTWLMLTVALQLLKPVPLTILGALLLAAALASSAARFATLMRRARYIMFSLLLIYGYATPGDTLYPSLGAFSPSLTGLQDGLLQLWRLSCALAALSFLLSRLNTQQLIGGIYTLASPLRLFGLSRERIAVRLALTLRYTETTMLESATNWRNAIEHMLAPVAPAQNSAAIPDEIELSIPPLTLRDGLLLIVGGTPLALALL